VILAHLVDVPGLEGGLYVGGGGIPRVMPCEQETVRAQEEAARAAGGVHDAERLHLRRRFAFQKRSYGVFDDVVNDVLRRVKNAACLAHLGFFLDLGLVAVRKAYGLAQKLLINVS